MNTQENETLRHAALEALVIRHPSALNPRQIERAVKREISEPFTETELESALEFLRSAKLAAVDFDGLGSTQYWSATHDGVTYYERNLK